MRLSCNGCRVLRKGCSEDCSIRPCLQWITHPPAQAKATLFLAKFYGRAGLLNLINAGPHHLRPAIFRSLLHEACGRIVNPLYGSVGLLWSGRWDLCQAAVESVLRGSPIQRISSTDAGVNFPTPPAYDIRHFYKNQNTDAAGNGLKKVSAKSCKRFKRSAVKAMASPGVAAMAGNLSPSRESSVTVANRDASNSVAEVVAAKDQNHRVSSFSHANSQGEASNQVILGTGNIEEEEKIQLELTLWPEPMPARRCCGDHSLDERPA